MTAIHVGAFTVRVSDGVPADYASLRERTQLLDEYELHSRESGTVTTVSISHAHAPVLVVAQHRALDPQIFPLGVLVVPETGLVLIGAAERLTAYDLTAPRKLWEDHVEVGFFDVNRHGDTVLVSGELSLTAYDLLGQQRWSMFVEPPWQYAMQGEHIEVDVMGQMHTFKLHSGPNTSAE